MKKHFTTYYKDFTIHDWVWMMIWFCLPLHFRISNFALLFGGMILLILFVRNPFLPEKKKLVVALLPIVYFGLHALNAFKGFGGIYLKELEQMASLVVIPFLYLISRSTKKKFLQASFTGFIFALLIMGVVMLGASAINFFKTYDINEFIYHQLTQPFINGSIYFSHMLLVALLVISKINIFKESKIIGYSISSFFLLLLFLAASKTILMVGIPLLIYNYRVGIKSLLIKRSYVFVVIVLALFALSIPIKNRLASIMNTDFAVVTQDQYQYNTPLNGLTLRLIQWRFGNEILKENKSRLLGVGITESQLLLNQKYKNYGIYTGVEGTSDKGYLNYNFHNQYVETLIRSGFVGLLILIIIMVKYITLFRANHFIPPIVLITYFPFLFTESVLERQVGIVLFCLLYFSVLLPERKIKNS